MFVTSSNSSIKSHANSSIKLHDLPSDIFRSILQYLPVQQLMKLDQATVSHNFQSLVRESVIGMTLVHNLDFYIPYGFPRPMLEYRDVNRWIIKRKCHVLTLYLRTNFGLIHDGILAESQSTLQKLLLVHDFVVQNPSMFSKHFPSMRTFIATDREFTGSVEQLQSLLVANPQLESIELRGGQNINSYCQVIGRNSPNLRHLVLRSHRAFDDLSIANLFSDDSRMRSLTELSLIDTRISNPDTLHNLIKSFPLLRSLTVTSSNLSSPCRYLYWREYVLPRLQCDHGELLIMALANFRSGLIGKQMDHDIVIEMMSTGFALRLIELLRSHDEELVKHAAGILSHISQALVNAQLNSTIIDIILTRTIIFWQEPLGLLTGLMNIDPSAVPATSELFTTITKLFERKIPQEVDTVAIKDLCNYIEYALQDEINHQVILDSGVLLRCLHSGLEADMLMLLSNVMMTSIKQNFRNLIEYLMLNGLFDAIYNNFSLAEDFDWIGTIRNTVSLKRDVLQAVDEVISYDSKYRDQLGKLKPLYKRYYPDDVEEDEDEEVVEEEEKEEEEEVNLQEDDDHDDADDDEMI